MDISSSQNKNDEFALIVSRLSPQKVKSTLLYILQFTMQENLIKLPNWVEN